MLYLSVLTLLVVVVSVTVNGCKPLHGPEADLATIVTPDPVPQAVRHVPQPPPGPVPGEGAFRAWVPRQVAANGDVIDGHWITVSLTPPAQASPPQNTPPLTPARALVPQPWLGGQ
jgi:hypothetical protein